VVNIQDRKILSQIPLKLTWFWIGIWDFELYIQGVLLLLQAAVVRRTTVNSTCRSSRAITTQRRQVCYVVT